MNAWLKRGINNDLDDGVHPDLTCAGLLTGFGVGEDPVVLSLQCI